MAAVKGVKLDTQHALQRLTKLQQAVDVTVKKLLSYVKTDWRNPKNLRHQIADIRDVAGKVKVALRLLTEFGLGTLVNAQNLPTPEMSGRVSRAIEPLLETYYSVKLALQKLDDQEWKTPLDRPESSHDDLDLIMVYIRSVPENSQKLAMIMRYGAPMLYGQAKAKAAATQEGVDTTPSSVQQGQDQKSQGGSAAVGREEVQAKIEKFGAAAMKAGSENVAATTHVVGQIVSPTNQNSANGRKLSPGTVRRLCDLDPPKLPHKDSISEGVPQSNGAKATPPRPPVRKDSGGKLVRRKSSEEESNKGAPPPKPRLDRQPTVRKRYDFSKAQERRDIDVVRREHKTLDVDGRPQSPRSGKKCNSDPTDFSDHSTGMSASGIPQRTSDSFDDSSVLEGGLTSKKMSMHISDTDLPQGPQSPTVRPKPLEFAKANLEKVLHENAPIREMDNGFLLNLSDTELLEFYKYEIDAQLFVLNEAMKNFYSCLEEKQPPKVFVSSSKFIVLSAHKFVFIGDTLQKKMKQSSVRSGITAVTNKLSGAIKLLVGATKSAALQFPAVNAMKEMSAAVANVLDIAVELHKEVKRTPVA